jgi:hypothetical protein
VLRYAVWLRPQPDQTVARYRASLRSFDKAIKAIQRAIQAYTSSNPVSAHVDWAGPDVLSRLRTVEGELRDERHSLARTQATDEHVTRKSKTKSASRTIFMALLASAMEDLFDRPHYEMVADITNILFGGKAATANAAVKAHNAARRRRATQPIRGPK